MLKAMQAGAGAGCAGGAADTAFRVAWQRGACWRATGLSFAPPPESRKGAQPLVAASRAFPPPSPPLS